MINYPVVCSSGHPDPVTITDDSSLISHHTSEHATVPIGDYRASLSSTSAAPAGNLPPPRPPLPTSILGRFGLLMTGFTDVQPNELNSGGLLTPTQVADFFIALGEEAEGISVNQYHFLLDLFILILHHAATDDVGNLGGTTLRDNITGRAVYRTWVQVQGLGSRFFAPLNLSFTFRRLSRSLDSLFWALWTNPEVKALDDLRQNGTPRSRLFKTKDHSPVAPYVVVPGLFDAHLTPEEVNIRRIYNKVVNLDKTGGGVSYTGNDSEAADDEEVRIALKQRALKMNHLWAAVGASGQAGITGVGAGYHSKKAPRQWD
jgi:hypothetical protein